MKVLFTAVGSIGTRHLKNLSIICEKKGIPLQADVIRYSKRVLDDDVKKLIRNEYYREDIIQEIYDVLFITDETGMHENSILKYLHLCKHAFVEKPIFSRINVNLDALFPVSKDRVYYVACPIRFSNYFNAISKVVSENEVYSSRVIFSSYMPRWQKGRDYRKSFRCFERRGGGVDIDSIHEIDYIRELYGMPQKVHRSIGKYSDFEMDACDVASYIFEYANKVVELHVDYFGQVNTRNIELYTKDDVIVIDFNKRNCIYKKNSIEEQYDEDNQFYQSEMEYFIDLICLSGGKENINPPQKAYENLCLAKGILLKY